MRFKKIFKFSNSIKRSNVSKNNKKKKFGLQFVFQLFFLLFLPHHHLLSFKGVIPRIYDLSFDLSINRVMLLVTQINQRGSSERMEMESS